MLVAIESSCDESAVSLIDLGKRSAGSEPGDYLVVDFLASQAAQHLPYGGVVPELAAREHIKNLPKLFHEALASAGVTADRISAVAVTRGPGLNGSLLIGLNFAKAFAYSRGIPLIPVNHLEGHIWAGELLGSQAKPKPPFLALIVSGGHTFLVSVRDFGNYEMLARTRDDAAGECFDKIATLLQLPYPGGPELARLAESGNASRFPLPISLQDDPTSFSFSGLKTAVNRLIASFSSEDFISDPQLRADLAASAEQAIVANLVEKTVAAAVSLNVQSVLISGGVAANLRLRKTLEKRLSEKNKKLVCPPLQWCTDNAAMIGVVGALRLEADEKRYFEWKQNRIGLGPDAPFDLSPLPRWPIDDGRFIPGSRSAT